VEESGDIN